MRLTTPEIQAIVRAVRAVFGETANVRVFGSRVRDDLKGGDLDLFIEAEPGAGSVVNEQRLRDLLGPALDDLRVDVVVHERGRPVSPIARIALRDGVAL